MKTEKRLIRLDDALEATHKEVFWTESEQAAVRSFLAKLPRVDAVEVVHGRWEPVDHDGSWRVDMCSICHRRMHYVDYDQPYQYCPNCGAKMDGDGNA